ncbi:MAG: TonB-dependent receptor [Gloeobacteraceae cyanobacterium ES-bin-316]|nr:TonB-dependent receptor [Ferruginibacter sp.]
MKFFFLILLIAASQYSFGQSAIKGKLTDTKNKPLAGASISIKDSYDGTTTDSLGGFSFSTTEKGNFVLEVTLSGYSSYTKNITLDGSAIILNIAIKELITELNAVVITAGSFEASDKKKGTVLTPLDIVTTASAEGDITGALKTLPGTQQVGETGGLFVRGGSAAEAKIYIDGNLVNNFFYSSLPGIASRGRFNPFLFKGTIFSAGGYSALYGQALSSALILESTDLPEKTEASLALSIIGVGGGIQKLAKDKKSSWGLTYNYANLGPAFAIIKQKQDYYINPVFHDGDANFRVKTKKGGMLKYYGYWSTSKVGYRTNDIDSAVLKNAFELDNFNTYQNINLKENIGNGWKLISGLSFSTNKDDISNELQDASNIKQVITNPIGYAFKNFGLLSKTYYAQARLVAEKKLQGLNTLRFGSDYFYSNEKSTYTLFDGTQYSTAIKDNLYAAFAETDFYISKDIAAKVGTRVEHSKLVDKWNIAPRISLAYKLKNNSQASFAYGIFYQNPETVYQPAATGSGYAKATHYILQFQRITGLRSFRTELFYKKYDNLFKTGTDNFNRQVAINNDGSGYAKGIEFFWRDKKTIKNMDYWVSYSFLDTKRDYLNFPSSMEPNFAARHTTSLVVKKFVLPWKTGFNAAYNFATGRPYYNLRYDNVQDKYVVADAGRTISYNNLGFSVNYLPNLGKQNKKAFIVWVLSVSNVLGQTQVFNYSYGSVTGNKQPIGPTSKRFAYIGCFISFGVDRTQDAINNNL